MEALSYIGYFFVLLGSIFLFLGALGIYRMPDVYNRLQAGTKSSTLGAMSTLFGIGLLQPDWMVKMFIIIIFIILLLFHFSSQQYPLSLFQIGFLNTCQAL